MIMTGRARVIAYGAMLLVLTGSMTAYAATATPITSSICSIVQVVRSFVAYIALLLFIVGAVLYALAHLLPAAGNMRGNLQGWSIGMIIGGIVGIILVLIAPGLINIIISSAGSGTSGITSIPAGC